MKTEIERKFLVNADALYSLPKGIIYSQGYLCNDPERTIRVRTAGKKGFLTIKGKTENISRSEYEYEIPLHEAEELLALCTTPPIEKIRYKVIVGNHIWEIDQFLGDNSGLWIAEIELEDENESFKMPHWIKEEVTHKPQYYNSYIALHPYKGWDKK